MLQQPQISWVLSAACQPGYGNLSMVMTTVNVLSQAT